MSELTLTPPQIGTVSWNELATSTPGESRDFYTSLFGWSAQEIPGSNYTMMMNGDREVAGLMDKSAMCDGPATWLPYFEVADLDSALSQSQELGGKEVVPSTTVENRGRFALIEDPQGGKLGLWESQREED